MAIGYGATTANLSEQQRLLNELANLTSPLRTQGANTLAAIMGGAPASSLPMYAPNRAAVEGQYGQARNAILANTPRGGNLYRRLADLEGNRASAVSNLEATTRQNAINQGLQLGFGATGQELSGYGNLANAYARMAEQERAAEQQNIQGITQGAGLLLGLLAGWGAS